MRLRGLVLSLTLLLALPVLVQAAPAGRIAGDYVEVRTADVFTGPCFANSEVGLTGTEAVLAWRIRTGSWDSVVLDGLSIVAVVRASATLGDPYSNPLPAQAVLLVDERASAAQQTALVAFARAQAGALLSDIVAIEAAPVRFAVEESRHGFVQVEAGNVATIATRAIGAADHFCHNEEVFYPPLASNLDHAMPAVATDSGYRGNHLGVTWREADRRGSFVGTFSF